MERDSLTEYLTTFLKAESFADYCPNGLQVEGRREVERLVTAVSASVELFARAAAEGADTILVHHGIIWQGQQPVYRGGHRERLRLLLENDINLYAYHLPLDAHPEVGNNAQLGRRLGLRNAGPFGERDGNAIGLRGELEAVPAEAFFEQVEQAVERRPLVFPFGPETIRTVGIISGGAQRDVTEAVACGLDAYITGEVSEPTLHYAKEEKIHFISAGHYATEKFGVLALGRHLAERFGLEVSFLDIYNPV
jgi:dinuclear metal center YbgI/SA1388 family protein